MEQELPTVMAGVYAIRSNADQDEQSIDVDLVASSDDPVIISHSKSHKQAQSSFCSLNQNASTAKSVAIPVGFFDDDP